jgi:hypothetical protein
VLPDLRPAAVVHHHQLEGGRGVVQHRFQRSPQRAQFGGLGDHHHRQRPIPALGRRPRLLA